MEWKETGAFQAWVERWRIGPGMNDPPDGGLYSGIDGTVGEGWIPILDQLADDLVRMGWDRQLDQVKEKYGKLRFYLRTGTAALRRGSSCRGMPASTTALASRCAPSRSRTIIRSAGSSRSRGRCRGAANHARSGSRGRLRSGSQNRILTG